VPSPEPFGHLLRRPGARGVAQEPGDEQGVAQAGVQHRGAGEEGVGECVADRPDPELIHGAGVLEQIDHLEHATPLRGVGVEPAEGGHGQMMAGGPDANPRLG